MEGIIFQSDENTFGKMKWKEGERILITWILLKEEGKSFTRGTRPIFYRT